MPGAAPSSVFDDYGWWIDDVRFYTCDACVANRVLTATYNGVAPFYGASESIEAGAGFALWPQESVAFEAPVVKLTDDFIGAGGELTIINTGCP